MYNINIQLTNNTTGEWLPYIIGVNQENKALIVETLRNNPNIKAIQIETLEVIKSEVIFER